jgi:hypothetical protein
VESEEISVEEKFEGKIAGRLIRVSRLNAAQVWPCLFYAHSCARGRKGRVRGRQIVSVAVRLRRENS